jgi:predicted nuclease with TOPRIM domain
MSWASDLAKYAKELLLLQSRVVSNSEEIKELRQDLKALTEFTRKVAYAVKTYEQRSEDKRENLVLTLQLELSKLQTQIAQTNNLNGATPPQHGENSELPSSALNSRSLPEGRE